MKIGIKKLYENATIPFMSTTGSSGYDLVSHYNDIVNPHESKLIKIGISVEIPIGYEAQIRPRSGLALKNSITVLNTPGTIDSDYRGEIGVILINHSNIPFVIESGMKIAQMVFQKIEIVEFDESIELLDTQRKGGFGSTGLLVK